MPMIMCVRVPVPVAVCCRRVGGGTRGHEEERRVHARFLPLGAFVCLRDLEPALVDFDVNGVGRVELEERRREELVLPEPHPVKRLLGPLLVVRAALGVREGSHHPLHHPPLPEQVPWRAEVRAAPAGHEALVAHVHLLACSEQDRGVALLLLLLAHLRLQVLQREHAFVPQDACNGERPRAVVPPLGSIVTRLQPFNRPAQFVGRDQPGLGEQAQGRVHLAFPMGVLALGQPERCACFRGRR
mmetsp:Transcript_20986/g.50665  ORF Transcript_20986/g.50665 Transcript_20986/m.50665 type:complete len:243 (+) Transcript_20986:633-1361(+)